jgi:hypothetical protein
LPGTEGIKLEETEIDKKKLNLVYSQGNKSSPLPALGCGEKLLEIRSLWLSFYFLKVKTGGKAKPNATRVVWL